MDISKIYQDYLNKRINSVNNVNNVNNVNSTSSTTGKSNSVSGISTDQLNLNSSALDLSAYLNYGAGGNYSDLTKSLSSDPNSSLIDLLGDGSTGATNGSGSPTGMDSLAELLNDDGSGSDSDSTKESNSIDSMFNSLAQSETAYVNTLIQAALNKLQQNSGTGSSTSASTNNTAQTTAATKTGL
jgi:hypothetical protein